MWRDQRFAGTRLISFSDDHVVVLKSTQRKICRCARVLHTRNRPDVLQQEIGERPCRGVIWTGNPNTGCDDAFRFKSRIYGQQISKTRDQQSGTAQQNKCECHLGHDKSSTKYASFAPGGSGPCFLMKGSTEIQFEKVNDGNQADHNAGNRTVYCPDTDRTV